MERAVLQGEGVRAFLRIVTRKDAILPPVPSQNLIRRLRAGMEEVREIEGSQFDTAPGRS